MVLTRSARKAWPPMADADGRRIALPESLYWDYVRPYTPVEDRVVVSKRCSTRYYAGDRIELDEDFLKNFEQRRMIKDSAGDDTEIVAYIGIPQAKGLPGTKDFRIRFNDSFSDRETDPAVAIQKLREARRAWDEHLSKILAPSERLHACLDLFYSNDSHNSACQLLFIGQEGVSDIINFHASINPSNIGGPATPQLGSQEVFPNTQLGYWIAVYLDSVIVDMKEQVSFCSTGRAESIIESLLEAGADVSPFFEPLERYPQQEFSALSALSGAFTLLFRGAHMFYGRGASLYHVMDQYARWLRVKGYDFEDQLHPVIEWLLAILKDESNIAIARPALRYNVGTRVKCNTVDPLDWEGVWQTGTIVKLSVKSHVYRVRLDEGELIRATVDADDCIVALTSPMEH